jgi:hypothetical protein
MDGKIVDHDYRVHWQAAVSELKMDTQVLKAMLGESRMADSLLAQLRQLPANSSLEYHPLTTMIYAVGVGRITEDAFYSFVVSQYKLVQSEINAAMERRNKDERGITHMLKGYLETYRHYIDSKRGDSRCSHYFDGV